MEQEKIIKRYLTAEQWEKESRAVAKRFYKDWADSLPDGEFKEFVLADEVLKTDEDTEEKP